MMRVSDTENHTIGKVTQIDALAWIIECGSDFSHFHPSRGAVCCRSAYLLKSALVVCTQKVEFHHFEANDAFSKK